MVRQESDSDLAGGWWIEHLGITNDNCKYLCVLTVSVVVSVFQCWFYGVIFHPPLKGKTNLLVVLTQSKGAMMLTDDAL